MHGYVEADLLSQTCIYGTAQLQGNEYTRALARNSRESRERSQESSSLEGPRGLLTM